MSLWVTLHFTVFIFICSFSFSCSYALVRWHFDDFEHALHAHIKLYALCVSFTPSTMYACLHFIIIAIIICLRACGKNSNWIFVIIVFNSFISFHTTGLPFLLWVFYSIFLSFFLESWLLFQLSTAHAFHTVIARFCSVARSFVHSFVVLKIETHVKYAYCDIVNRCLVATFWSFWCISIKSYFHVHKMHTQSAVSVCLWFLSKNVLISFMQL